MITNSELDKLSKKEIEKMILKYQKAYYNSDEPLVSDEEFDLIWDYLKDNYPDSNLLSAIGEDHFDGFKKAKHTITMGSQNKANTEDEMNKFFKKNGKDYICQFKCDGISLEINFKNGVLVSAITRGDGYVGDDCTENAKKMKGIPLKLKDKTFTGAVRGEILLFRKDKDKYFPDMKNCRNAASGITKRLDGKGSNHLTLVCYDAQRKNGKSFGTQEKLQEWLKENGFNVAYYTVVKNATGKKAMEILTKIFNDFDSLQYDIDGLVWKSNRIDMNDLSNYRPESQIALKPARVSKVTKLLDIKWQMNSGTLTPIAILKPVELNGTTVKQANLCNVNIMMDLGIEIGDNIIVSKAGMIIPQVTGKAN